MVEVFTIGGGEYIVNTFNAVAAWTGGGGYRALLRVVMVLGLIYALLAVAFTMNVRAWLNWFLGSSLIYMCLMVPTVSVKVTDRINPSLAPATVANVPLGLGVIASFTSQVGDWLTRTAETVFTMPSQLSYSSNGMVYGARLLDATRNFQIRDAEFSTNLSSHFKNCTFGDIMLGQKSMTDLAAAKDLWAAMGPGSAARSQPWVVRSGAATDTQIIPCRAAYAELSRDWVEMIKAHTPLWAKETYPKLSTAVASAKLQSDVPIVNQAFLASSANYETIVRQNTAINAFMMARDGMSGGPGAASIDTFATTRADIQARNTYNSIAQQAMSWVPILNIVLTVVFYAMFPVIFPLFLMPQTGVGALKGYMTGFFYLAAWGPLYVILHMICMTRATGAAQGVSEGGMSLGTYAGIGAVNAETATIAGFMLMSVPFLAAGLAKGAMSISGQATSVLSPAQNAAEAAAAEQTTGNYSYGNTSFASSTSNMRQSDQWQNAPTFSTGGIASSFRHGNGATSNNFGDGQNVYDTSKAISNIPFNTSAIQSAMATESRQSGLAARVADGFEQASRREVSHLNALRNGHSWSNESSSGFSSSSGDRGGSNTELSDRRTIADSDGVQNRHSVGDGTGHRVETGKNTNWSDQITGGVKVGVGASSDKKGSGGGPLAAAARFLGINGEISGGYSQTYLRADTTGNTDSANTSRDNSISLTDGVNRDHASGRSVSTNDGTFHQNESFARSSNSEARTRAIEESLSKIESYNEQARHYRELSQSLEQHASYSESSGFNLSTDLRQDLARWYDKENAASPGGNMLPGLWETNLDSTRENARNIAIGKWASERSGAIERDIQSALENPALANMKLPGVASEASIARHYSGGAPVGAAHPVSTGKPDTSSESDIISSGARELLDEERRQKTEGRRALASGPKGPETD
ncbi:conjugal transfer protein TraG N-terminal domain-containing protein [Sphingomonas sp. CFBP 8760]|uniref:conjugal transfer protein TraG N-terminal domain-containing protein n=1 Tax=Sphingomonas sp. CFBP 8760 TaxID=2775282 RepID=UPI00177CD13F|nr:conjugal transfer protein TraG N-terminal domain-containing protein [Sphingomonas sp. CFBP 8760]MBD8546879.1 conjugal transfer protein TraG N-terminal domain-containing protein [Sphingomonas sp. CFBP 8760]